MKKLLLIFIFTSFLFNVKAQEPVSFFQTDSLTYKYYLSQQWDSLISTGKKALENNIDYFFLRSRMGKAYFEKQNYVKSALHFEKALEMNSTDVFVISHLYHSYKNSGRTMESYLFYKNHPEAIEPENKPLAIHSVFFDSGVTQNGNKKIATNMGVDTTSWSETNFTKDMIFTGAGLSYFVNKNIKLTNYFSLLNINNTKQITIDLEKLEDNYKLIQNEAYLSATVNMKNKFSIIAAYHYLNVDFSTLYSTYDTALQKVTLTRKNILLDDHVVSLAAEKRFSYFGLNIFGVYSSLNKARQKEGGLIFSSYPLGNLNLYTNTTIAFHKGKKNTNFIAEQKLGGKLYKYVWAEAFITLGKLKNYSEQNGLVVHNITDVVKQRYGASLIFTIKKIQFRLTYQNITRETEFRFFQSAEKTGTATYNNHYLLGSFSVKF